MRWYKTSNLLPYEKLLADLESLANIARNQLRAKQHSHEDLAIIGAHIIGQHGPDYEQFCQHMSRELHPHGLRMAKAPGSAAAVPLSGEELYQKSRQEFQKRIPNKEAVDAALAYTNRAGLPPPRPHQYAKVDPNYQKKIADAYEALPSNPNDPSVQQAYAQLTKEIEDQYNSLPIKVIPWADPNTQPYANSKEMMQDVLNNKQMKVFTGGEDHPILNRDANFKLRAIHDYYGHAQFGFEFGTRGEENAWIEHSKMFSPLARKALTTETRGQSSYVNAGPYSHLPANQRPYAQQKAGILPEEFHTHPALQQV